MPTTSDETLFQIGFVTRDIHASMREFTQELGVGPWHLRERGVFPVQFYRGEPTSLALAVAMGYAPSSALQYELIQPLDDLPSIYTECPSDRQARVSITTEFSHETTKPASRAIEAKDLKRSMRPRFRAGASPSSTPPSSSPAWSKSCSAPTRWSGCSRAIGSSSIGWDGADPVKVEAAAAVAQVTGVRPARDPGNATKPFPDLDHVARGI